MKVKKRKYVSNNNLLDHNNWFSLQNQSFLCTIEIDGTDVRESAISKSYKNSKNIAAAKVLQKLDTQKIKSKN